MSYRVETETKLGKIKLPSYNSDINKPDFTEFIDDLHSSVSTLGQHGREVAQGLEAICGITKHRANLRSSKLSTGFWADSTTRSSASTPASRKAKPEAEQQHHGGSVQHAAKCWHH